MNVCECVLCAALMGHGHTLFLRSCLPATFRIQVHCQGRHLDCTRSAQAPHCRTATIQTATDTRRAKRQREVNREKDSQPTRQHSTYIASCYSGTCVYHLVMVRLRSREYKYLTQTKKKYLCIYTRIQCHIINIYLSLAATIMFTCMCA